ncbi:MAG TPA: S8 family serine peptidase, partial [Gaiellaceae bacterium]|nr:S8 family serine peptidase [Gaiellaceae bacterium]
MVARTDRKWTARAVLGTAVLAAVGLLSASALAAVDPTTGSSSSDATASDTTGTPSNGPDSSSPEYIAGTDSAGSTPLFLVKFVSGTSAAAQADAIAAAGGTDVSSIAPLRLHTVSFAGSAEAGVAALGADPSVARVEADRSRELSAEPSDTHYAGQWALPKIGWDQVYGTVAPAGSATVAVLDTGVDASHPDLQGQVVPGTNVVTDQGDGRTDPNGHGTAMAGIVAAATDNNGEGIAGVGYAGVSVMPVTVLGADGTGQDSDIIEGVVYAADHGADVILMAFSNPGFSASLQDAIDYAWAQGAVLVAAAGNDATSEPTFPAGDRGVMGVSSTDMSDALALGSNYGQDTFLGAPGFGIETTTAGGG